MHILHVDDEPDIREIARISLEMTDGVSVASAECENSAFIYLRGKKPDAILLDMMMPNMSGPEFKARLDAEESLRDIPVIFLTAAARPETIRDLLELGATGVIQKPFDPMTLSDQLMAILSERKWP